MPRYWNEPILEPTDTIRQHYVPRLLLREFCVNGTLDVCDVMSKRRFSTSPENVGLESGYYDVAAGRRVVSAESWLSEIEGVAAPVLACIRTDPYAVTSLSAKEENDLARFVCAQHLRTSDFREMDARMRQQTVEQIRELSRRYLYASLASEEADEIWRVWKDRPDEWFLQEKEPYQVAATAASMLSEVQGLANILRAMPWRIGVVASPPGIYLGDNPVVRRELTDVPFAGYPEHTYYLPLSSKVLFSAGPHLSGSKRGPRQANDFSRWETSIARHLTTANATRHLFGRGPYVSRECADSCLERLTREDWRLTVKTRRPPEIFRS
jgi:hypothetical protein